MASDSYPRLLRDLDQIAAIFKARELLGLADGYFTTSGRFKLDPLIAFTPEANQLINLADGYFTTTGRLKVDKAPLHTQSVPAESTESTNTKLMPARKYGAFGKANTINTDNASMEMNKLTGIGLYSDTSDYDFSDSLLASAMQSPPIPYESEELEQDQMMVLRKNVLASAQKAMAIGPKVAKQVPSKSKTPLSHPLDVQEEGFDDDRALANDKTSEAPTAEADSRNSLETVFQETIMTETGAEKTGARNVAGRKKPRQVRFIETAINRSSSTRGAVKKQEAAKVAERLARQKMTRSRAKQLPTWKPEVLGARTTRAKKVSRKPVASLARNWLGGKIYAGNAVVVVEAGEVDPTEYEVVD